MSIPLEALTVFDKSIDACWFHSNNVHLYQLDLNQPLPHTFKYTSTATNLFITESTSLNTFQLIISTGRGFTSKVLTPQTLVELKGNIIYIYHRLDDTIWAYHLNEANELNNVLVQILNKMGPVVQSSTFRSNTTTSTNPSQPTPFPSTNPHPTPSITATPSKAVVKAANPLTSPYGTNETPKLSKKAAKKAAAAALAASMVATTPSTPSTTQKFKKNNDVEVPEPQIGSFYYEMNKIQGVVGQYTSPQFSQSILSSYGVQDGAVITTMLSSLEAQLRALTLLAARSDMVQFDQINSVSTHLHQPQPPSTPLFHHPHRQQLQLHHHMVEQMNMGLMAPGGVGGASVDALAIQLGLPPINPIIPLISIDDIKTSLVSDLRPQVEMILATGPPEAFITTLEQFFQAIIRGSQFTPQQSTQPINKLLGLFADKEFLAQLMNSEQSVEVQNQRDSAQYTFLNTLFDSITMLHPSLAQASPHLTMFELNYNNVQLFIKTFIQPQDIMMNGDINAVNHHEPQQQQQQQHQHQSPQNHQHSSPMQSINENIQQPESFQGHIDEIDTMMTRQEQYQGEYLEQNDQKVITNNDDSLLTSKNTPTTIISTCETVPPVTQGYQAVDVDVTLAGEGNTGSLADADFNVTTVSHGDDGIVTEINPIANVNVVVDEDNAIDHGLNTSTHSRAHSTTVSTAVDLNIDDIFGI